MKFINYLITLIMLLSISAKAQNLDAKIIFREEKGDKKIILDKATEDSAYVAGTIYFLFENFDWGYFIHQPNIHKSFKANLHHYNYYDTDYYQYIKRLRNRKCADLEDVDERWLCNTENSFENIFNQFFIVEKIDKYLKIYEVRFIRGI